MTQFHLFFMMLQNFRIECSNHQLTAKFFYGRRVTLNPFKKVNAGPYSGQRLLLQWAGTIPATASAVLTHWLLTAFDIFAPSWTITLT